MKDHTEKSQTARTRASKGLVLASAITLIIGGITIAPVASRMVVAAETPKAQPSVKPTEGKAVPTKPEPISLKDYLDGVSKPGISPSDQASFAKKHVGANVTWTGYVRAVSKNISPNGPYYQLILNENPTEEEGAPRRLFVAQFGGDVGKELEALKQNQKVTVSGSLELATNPAFPTVADAKLSGS